MSAARAIQQRISQAPEGTVLIPSDFFDIASVENANTTLSRMASSGDISRIVRGIYAKPKHSTVLNKDIPPSPNDVAQAIARSNKWIIVPSGDTALNMLGLDTQVPAAYEYVSSGPYKSYEYANFTITMKHRANRDLLDCSPLTCLIIQALKTLGRDKATPDIARQLASRLSTKEINTFYQETQTATSWIFKFAKQLKELKRC